jgi:radical SAM protein with 4Fe4S-binding SPASM domain
MSFECATQWIQRCLNNRDNDSWSICLFGGEPLLQFPLVKRICEWTWQQHWPTSYLFLLQTNGTLLNADMKEWFCQNKDRIGLCLSIDGRRETHNKNRNYSFDRIDLVFFRSVWPTMPVKMTISRDGIYEIKDNVVWLHEQGFSIRGCNLAVGEGKLSETDFNAFAEQLKKLADYYIANPSIDISPILDIPLYLLSSPSDLQRRICNLGTDKLIVVNTDGSTSPCSFFSNVSSNRNDASLEEQLKDLRTKKTKCFYSCSFSPICDVCYAENYTETGSIYTPSHQRCRLMKMRIAAAMYLMANRIAYKEKITYEDTLTIKSIQLFNHFLKTTDYGTL